MRPDAPLFPELDDERRQLADARACRDRMIERFEQLDPDASADEITKDYIEVTVKDALADLRTPGAGDFFGRIDGAVKGLEFDGVVVVNPAEIFDGSERGARLLYVAMTRAVQELHMVGDTRLNL